MGILNVTPDSFSDGGAYADPGAACAHAEQMRASGADIIDIGGQSTRPGAPDVDEAEEWRRVGPVLTRLVRDGHAVSVDTLHAGVARRAIDAGALLINDVSGGTADPQMGTVIAASSVGYVAQHWRGTPATMDAHCDYPDGVVTGVLCELAHRLRDLAEAGVDLGRVIIDPGLGFAKTTEQSWHLAAATARLRDTGFPVLIGASRKRFLAACGGEEAQQRDPATAAVSALVAAAGAWAVRVHDVAPSVQAVRVGRMWKEHA
ncbi:dihydropteroate synthase [Nanchangia anserum]|uniref:dihydropteroate synthase n=2 Tax=Nanchangia anserum TaxID=2692125 RepID=A0A8I0KQ08_9ACTO|nr:dihydropteroate synthase [Nanchangia anserum]MBD3689465.1 dihydropteroate synthase [Nanchangia anserum]QOX82654.1 dihydropteroate synthase [Nanchangia anserum]